MLPGAGSAGGVLGHCTAQYDYAANQLNQLSLKVNDRIAILSKAGGSMGWWKGQCNGKVGRLFTWHLFDIVLVTLTI